MYVHYDVPVLVHTSFRSLERLVWVRSCPFSGPTAVRLVPRVVPGV